MQISLERLEWNRGPDMPFHMAGRIQAVEVKGTLYVGGGMATTAENRQRVMAFDTNSSKWDTLTPYIACEFAMTAINGKLVLVGGHQNVELVLNLQRIEISNELGEWQPDSGQWTYPFPRMPLGLMYPSAFLHNNLLVAVGKVSKKHDLYHITNIDPLEDLESPVDCYNGSSTIEILDISSNEWLSSTPITVPAKFWDLRKSVVIDDTCYFMSSAFHSSPLDLKKCSEVPLEEMCSITFENHLIGNEISTLKSSYCSPLSIGGFLFAVGGAIKEKSEGGIVQSTFEVVSAIHQYVPGTNSWVSVGNLPQPMMDCCCIFSSNKIFVMGGRDGQCCLNNSMYFSEI